MMMHQLYDPYVDDSLDELDRWGLFVLLVLYVSGIWFHSSELLQDHPELNFLIGLIDVLLLLSFVAKMFVHAWPIAKETTLEKIREARAIAKHGSRRVAATKILVRNLRRRKLNESFDYFRKVQLARILERDIAACLNLGLGFKVDILADVVNQHNRDARRARKRIALAHAYGLSAGQVNRAHGGFGVGGVFRETTGPRGRQPKPAHGDEDSAGTRDENAADHITEMDEEEQTILVPKVVPLRDALQQRFADTAEVGGVTSHGDGVVSGRFRARTVRMAARAHERMLLTMTGRHQDEMAASQAATDETQRAGGKRRATSPKAAGSSQPSRSPRSARKVRKTGAAGALAALQAASAKAPASEKLA
jgi:hypothetical protein